MPFSNNPKGMSQVMTIILTTVIGTMIAAIIGLSAGDIIPGAFSDTGEQSCIQQIETTCQTSQGSQNQNAPAACSGIDLEDEFGGDAPGFDHVDSFNDENTFDCEDE